MIMKNLTITALLATVFLFLIILGISLLFEFARTEEISRSLAETDVLWNDARFFGSYIEASNLTGESCDLLAEENRVLGDRIYGQGMKIEKYEGANKLTDSLLTEKKRYALLDLQFWENSISIKKKCGQEFSTVIYFYSQYNKTNGQKTMDRVLGDFKKKCGRAIVYITFPTDMDLSSIDLIKKTYSITKIPSVLIDERTVLSGEVSMEELNKYAKCW